MSRIADAPFDQGGTHAVDKARRGAPGPGMWVSRLRWCFACQKDVLVGGGRMVGPLWKCAGCSKRNSCGEK